MSEWSPWLLGVVCVAWLWALSSAAIARDTKEPVVWSTLAGAIFTLIVVACAIGMWSLYTMAVRLVMS